MTGMHEAVIDQITSNYHYDQQLEVFVEECAEAIQAAQKCKRYPGNDTRQHLMEEVADVLIMAEQMRLYLGADNVDSFVNQKLQRQLDRIIDEKGIAADD